MRRGSCGALPSRPFTRFPGAVERPNLAKTESGFADLVTELICSAQLNWVTLSKFGRGRLARCNNRLAPRLREAKKKPQRKVNSQKEGTHCAKFVEILDNMLTVKFVFCEVWQIWQPSCKIGQLLAKLPWCCKNYWTFRSKKLKGENWFAGIDSPEICRVLARFAMCQPELQLETHILICIVSI